MLATLRHKILQIINFRLLPLDRWRDQYQLFIPYSWKGVHMELKTHLRWWILIVLYFCHFFANGLLSHQSSQIMTWCVYNFDTATFKTETSAINRKTDIVTEFSDAVKMLRPTMYLIKSKKNNKTKPQSPPHNPQSTQLDN